MAAKTASAKAGNIFTIDQAAFAKALGAVVGTVERKTTIPVLSNVLLESTDDGKLKITGTDLDMTIIRTTEANIVKPFAASVSARKLHDIVKLLPAGEISFDLEENHWLNLKAGKSKFRLAGVDKETFPESPKSPPSPIIIPSETLRRFIRMTQNTITAEQSRFTLSGAKFEIADGSMRMITTDGHRLSFIEDAIDTDEKVDIIIPKKALIEAAKIDAEEITFGASDRHIIFATTDETLISRQLTGRFPNYEMVMPKDNDKRVVVSAAELRGVIKRVSQMADERNRSIRMTFRNGEIEITASSSEEGEAVETLAAEYDGDEIVFGFNWHYLLDAVEVVDQEKKIAISFKDSNSQTEFSVDGESDHKHIIMPLRV